MFRPCAGISVFYILHYLALRYYIMLTSINIRACLPYCLALIITLSLFSSPAYSQLNSDSADSDIIKVVKDELPKEKVLNEGYFVAGRRARLVSHPDNKRWFLVFNKPVNGQPVDIAANNSDTTSAPEPDTQEPVSVIELLPSRWLETMLRVVNNTSDYNIIFRVWGNVTVYQDRNFLFLTMVATESLFGDSAQQNDKSNNTLSPFSQTPDSSSTTKDLESSGIVPDSVRDKLMAVPRVEVVSFPFKMKETDQDTVTIAENDVAAFKNDMIISDRVGRIFPNQSEGRIYFMFESGDGITGGSQIVLQPCLLLEKMVEKASSAAGQNFKFRISGRVDEFKGEFFLFPTMYLQEGYRGI